jgi:CRP-like cAMP-binding protein
VVIEGIVARFGQNSEGERQIIALHIEGDAPDLHTVVLPSDTVPLHALSKSTILRIPHSALRELAAKYPAVAEAFWRHCSVDAAITARWVVNVGRRDAKTRISHLLCEMVVRHGLSTGEGELTVPFPLTQVQLADVTGLTAVHVNRTLKALAAEGIVTLSSRAARIPNWQQLVERGEFDPGYLQAGPRSGKPLRILN